LEEAVKALKENEFAELDHAAYAAAEAETAKAITSLKAVKRGLEVAPSI